MSLFKSHYRNFEQNGMERCQRSRSSSVWSSFSVGNLHGVLYRYTLHCTEESNVMDGQVLEFGLRFSNCGTRSLTHHSDASRKHVAAFPN